MKQLRIYVAGPITSKYPEIVKQNIEKAKKIGEELLKMGHLPYVPHTHFADWDLDIHKNYDTLQQHGEEILEKWADALFFIAPSNGANLEKTKAEKLGLPIYTNLEQIGKVK